MSRPPRACRDKQTTTVHPNSARFENQAVSLSDLAHVKILVASVQAHLLYWTLFGHLRAPAKRRPGKAKRELCQRVLHVPKNSHDESLKSRISDVQRASNQRFPRNEEGSPRAVQSTSGTNVVEIGRFIFDL